MNTAALSQDPKKHTGGYGSPAGPENLGNEDVNDSSDEDTTMSELDAHLDTVEPSGKGETTNEEGKTKE